MRSVDQKVLRSIRRYTEFFADLALQDYSIVQYKPSIISVACVLCSRRTNRIKPMWNPFLKELTGYEFNDVRVCFNQLY